MCIYPYCKRYIYISIAKGVYISISKSVYIIIANGVKGVYMWIATYNCLASTDC